MRSLQADPGVRRAENLFVVEGVRLVEEAFHANWGAKLVLYTEELGERGLSLVEKFHQVGVVVEKAAPKVMRSASDTQTPQGILAVIPMRSLPLPERPDFLVILDALRDPGNLGAILRSAAAAGVQGVILTPGSVDPYSPKVVRAGMGAHFRLPVASMDWKAISRLAKEAGLQLYLAMPGAGQAYFQVDLRTPLALILGGEAHGPGEEIRWLADAFIHIPMPGGSESLNAAVSAGILMYEVLKQRWEKIG